MDLLHSRAARKPLMANILNILQCMFYSRSISSAHNWIVNNLFSREHQKKKLDGKVSQTVLINTSIIRLGYLPRTYSTLSELSKDSDKKLFFLAINYLRPKGHSFELPRCALKLHKNLFYLDVCLYMCSSAIRYAWFCTSVCIFVLVF